MIFFHLQTSNKHSVADTDEHRWTIIVLVFEYKSNLGKFWFRRQGVLTHKVRTAFSALIAFEENLSMHSSL